MDRLTYSKRNDLVSAVRFPVNEFNADGYRVMQVSSIARDVRYVIQLKYADGWKDSCEFEDYSNAKLSFKEVRGSRFAYRLIARQSGYRHCVIKRN